MKAILQAAADGGTSGVLKQVIDEGKVGVVDDDGSTPLMYAAASGREEVMRKLLGKEVRRGRGGEEGEREGRRGRG